VDSGLHGSTSWRIGLFNRSARLDISGRGVSRETPDQSGTVAASGVVGVSEPPGGSTETPTPEAWSRFTGLLEQGRKQKQETGKSMWMKTPHHRAINWKHN